MSTVVGNGVAAAMAARVGPGFVEARDIPPDLTWVRVARGDLRAAARAVKEELNGRFLISVGTDQRPANGGFGVAHIFALDAEHWYVGIACDVGEEDPTVDSITDVVPGASWSERECRDMLGVEAVGHPDARRLVLPDDWPDGVFPLRRDFPYNERPPAVEGLAPRALEPPEGASVIPVGPFFPVLEEPAQLLLFVEGETVVGCDYRGFYNHRGIEKMGDSVLTYDRIPFVAERICGICGFIHSTAYCQAVEKAAGIEVPRRAEYIRTLMLELERIHSHLLWLGIAGHIIGFDTVLMQTWRIREPVMWLTEEISGNRKTYGMNLIGGVRRDITPAQMPKIVEVVDEIAREAVAVRDAISGDTTLHARTRNVGLLSGHWAREICVVGPPARASGVGIDARIDHPYAAYDEVVPRLCTQEAGDSWARVLVRLDELEDSIRLVKGALAGLPDGAIRAEVGPIPEERMGVSVVEAPRGEAIHYVHTGPDSRPYRWRVRAPTYPNLQALPAMIQGETIADVPITLGSLDPCFSCTERVETVDVRDGRRRIYTRAELEELARRGPSREGVEP
jgi:Ni,Fe-hydrogenase III large subunit/Ni,Fe-hydrogenase III component G